MTTATRSHVNKLPSLKNFRPAFDTNVENPGITPIHARTLGRASHVHKDKAPKQVRVIRTRSQICKGMKQDQHNFMGSVSSWEHLSPWFVVNCWMWTFPVDFWW
jgi:hypothetical protein